MQNEEFFNINHKFSVHFESRNDGERVLDGYDDTVNNFTRFYLYEFTLFSPNNCKTLFFCLVTFDVLRELFTSVIKYYCIISTFRYI